MCFFKKMKQKKYGFIPSKIDGTEHIYFGNGVGSDKIPDTYSYKEFLPEILDQGQDSICVPCSISTFLNWRENLKNGSSNDNHIDYFEIYDIREGKHDGMTFKDAFNYLRHHGVKSDIGVLKIQEYAMIQSFWALRTAILMNGPCVGALPVYNNRSDFWNKKPGDFLMGYHAIAIVGYNNDGFLIRNSWGEDFGDEGYTEIPYEEFPKFIEIWTVIN